MRKLLLAAVVAATALTGCTSRVGDSNEPPPSSTTPALPVELSVSIEFRPVLTTGTPELTLPGEDGEQLGLAEPIMTVNHLSHAEAKLNEQGTDWLLQITLDDHDAKTFADWTTDHTGERMAMVADNEVLTAPTIATPITGGDLQITGDYTKSEAEALLAKLTGE